MILCIIKIVSLTHSLTHWLTHSLTHSLTHPLIHSLTHSFTQPLTHILSHLLTQSLTHSLTQSLSHSWTHSLLHFPTHSLLHFPHSLAFICCYILLFMIHYYILPPSIPKCNNRSVGGIMETGAQEACSMPTPSVLNNVRVWCHLVFYRDFTQACSWISSLQLGGEPFWAHHCVQYILFWRFFTIPCTNYPYGHYITYNSGFHTSLHKIYITTYFSVLKWQHKNPPENC